MPWKWRVSVVSCGWGGSLYFRAHVWGEYSCVGCGCGIRLCVHLLLQGFAMLFCLCLRFDMFWLAASGGPKGGAVFFGCCWRFVCTIVYDC